MINRCHVTGRYRGTTDEILQWAARKWGFDPDLFRAVATVESYWNMSVVGDGGLSFGIFQMKRATTAARRSARATQPSTPTTTAPSCGRTSTASRSG